MGQFHSPSHFDGPPEEEKGPSVKAKLIMTTTRDVVLAILAGKKSIELNKYTKSVDINHPPKHAIKKKKVLFSLPHSLHGKNRSPFKDDERHQNTVVLKKKVKDAIHDGLKLVGIHKGNTDKRITKALTTLGSQYKNMSKERFLHRLENGKVFRDAQFILAMVKYMSQIGPSGVRELLDILSSTTAVGGFQNFSNSEAITALSFFIAKAKEVITSLKGEKGFKKFLEELKNYPE